MTHATHLDAAVRRPARRLRAVLAALAVRFAIGLAALCGCMLPSAGAQASKAGENGAPPAGRIDTITLERDCAGCPSGSVLVLRRDGSASYTVTGKARRGTEDKPSRGTIRPDDFDALARLVLTRGFFALDEVYDDPQLQDGAWTTIAITRNGEAKQVFRRDDTGPAALKAIEARIDAARARITFAP
jgi:hypothetical protein